VKTEFFFRNSIINYTLFFLELFHQPTLMLVAEMCAHISATNIE